VKGKVDIDGREITAVCGEKLARDAQPEGPFILPGFIDLHVHGGGGADWQDGEEGIRNFVRFHTSHGTTAIAPTTATGTVRAIEGALSDIGAITERRRPGEAIVLGAHLEGPFVNPKKPGAMNPDNMLEGDSALTKRWAERCKIVVATVAPEIPGGYDVAKALAATGCRVQVGHSIATPDLLEEAFQSGFSGITHLFNAMSQMEHRAPGVAAYALARVQYAEMISDLVHVDTTVLLAAYRAIPRLYAITDASAAGMPDGNYQWGGRQIIKKGLRVTLDNGTTLAGSAITMLDALQNLVKIGLSLEQASDMTASRPAEYLGMKDIGRIEPGARASLVKLDQELRLEGVWVDGESVTPAPQATLG
jgi:N-acetylglucosamine-6-phosphate deacetylase